MEIEDDNQNEINQSQFCIENFENSFQNNSMKDQSQFIDNYDQNCNYSTNYDESNYLKIKQNIQQINYESVNSQNTITESTSNNNIQQHKRKRKNKQVGFINICQNINFNNSIRVSSGLLIDPDGTIRFSNSMGFFSFGTTPWQAQSMSYQKQYKIVNCQVADESNQRFFSIDEALEILKKMSYCRFDELKYALQLYQFARKHMLEQINQIQISSDILNEHDESYLKHIESCEQYVQNYSQQNAVQMFQFCIGRINLARKDVEVARCGFSKSYLDFIGLDLDIFNQILLRKQKVDLIKNKEEIFSVFTEGMKSRFQYNADYLNQTLNIVTFDGFPIKIQFRKQDLQPNAQYKKVLPQISKNEFIFHITEIDIDLQDLQNLILYRERLAASQNNLSYEDFLKKELSYLFEDVEYSVHSQAFAEKFYQQNVQKLKKIQKQQVQQQDKQKKWSGYRLVSSTEQIRPIQIN
ncbi:hypothetical protein ABPG74_000366 [Tetrahymena malaccensis]